jgi:hypothetical protein
MGQVPIRATSSFRLAANPNASFLCCRRPLVSSACGLRPPSIHRFRMHSPEGENLSALVWVFQEGL